MNKPQRVVVIVSLGLALVVLAIAMNLVMTEPLEPFWFRVSGGSSHTDDYFVVASDRSILEQAAVWVAGLALWTGASLWLLRDREAS